MSTLTPREIVAELDKFVVGQEQAKRMVAVAVRNRWRRQHLPEELRDEGAPKNIIMMGPTGVGKTEIARRLAKLSGAPFIKVEATKFTEVGYVGRDVESMVRDLMEIGITLVREEENTRVRAAAEVAAESRLLDLLLPNSFGGDRNDTREKLRQQFRLGFMDDREVEVEVTEQPAQGVDMFAIPGMEQMGNQVRDMFSKAFPPRRSRRKMKVREAYNVLIQEESGKLVDQEALVDKARERVEQMGIIFIDEIDKIASSSQNRTSDISREGVQRDLLPIVEGSAVNTKYGMVRTDHILFIAAGASGGYFFRCTGHARCADRGQPGLCAGAPARCPGRSGSEPVYSVASYFRCPLLRQDMKGPSFWRGPFFMGFSRMSPRYI